MKEKTIVYLLVMMLCFSLGFIAHDELGTKDIVYKTITHTEIVQSGNYTLCLNKMKEANDFQRKSWENK